MPLTTNASRSARLRRLLASSRVRSLSGAALCLGVLLALFHRVVFFGHLPAFRDVATFFYPWHLHIRALWYHGIFPGWNPYENLGVPLLAQGTAAVFYPGAWLLLLPGPFSLWWRLFLLGHLLLAAGTTWWLLRRWGRSIWAAWLGAICYAYSGQVLFMHTNPPFLVSAAWAPLALGLIWQCVSAPRRNTVVPLAGVLSLITLGGDPQMVVHLGLLGVLLWWMRRRQSRQQARQGSGTSPTRAVCSSSSGRGLVALAGAGLLSLGLSAVQVLPTQQLASLSTRSEAPYPRTVWEVPLQLDRLGPAHRYWGLGYLLARSDQGDAEHMRHVYQFSLAPWRLGELLWPGVSGRYYPRYTRWMRHLGWEDRAWTLSLYLGVIPLVCSLAAWRLRRGRLRRRWLSWTLVLATVASFGSYALGWLGRLGWQAAGGAPDHWPLGDGFGGLYWLLVVLVPKYVQFRYPAKWFTLATLALALLAAHGADALLRSRKVRQRALWLGGAALLLTALAAGAWRGLQHRIYRASMVDFNAPPKEDVPFPHLAIREQEVHRQVICSFVHASVVLLAAWVAIRMFPRKLWPALLLLLTAGELVVANSYLVGSAAGWLFDLQSWRFLSKIKGPIPLDWHESTPPPAGPIRFKSGGWPDPGFLRYPNYRSFLDAEEDPFELTEMLYRHRVYLNPKWNLPYRVPTMESFQTLEIASWRRFWRAYKERFFPLGFLGGFPTDFCPIRDLARLVPVCWEQLQAQPEKWLQFEPGNPDFQEPQPGNPRMVRLRPGLMEFRARCERPSVLVLPWQHYPDWVAWRISRGDGRARPLAIHRISQAMMAVELPPGEHRVRLVYRSRWIYAGLWISAACWLATALFHRRGCR